MKTQLNAVFRGQFEIKLDPKGRLSLPASCRQMAKPKKALNNIQMVVTNSRYRAKSCLHLYSLAEWERLERRIGRLSPLTSTIQDFNRFYLSGGQLVDVDAQNRILIPLSLRRFAGLQESAVLVGLGEKCELWSLDNWQTIYSHLTENFEETMNSVALLEAQTGVE